MKNQEPDVEKRGNTLLESVMAVVGGIVVAIILVAGLNMQANKSSATSSAKVIEEVTDVDKLHMSEVEQNPLQCSGKDSGKLECLLKPANNSCTIGNGELCDADIEMARIAWKYFENNYNPETGLVNAVNNFPSTTMWDSGSALAATVAAYDFGFITKKDFDDRITKLYGSLTTMQLFNDEAPNKVYNTKTLAMVDYANKATEVGIGSSILDMARLMSWSRTLTCMHPKFEAGVTNALSRWKYERLVKEDQLFGLAISKTKPGEINVFQEGRLGYEQYAGKVFQRFGFKVDQSASYENQHRGSVDILGVPIGYDTRDPRKYHANNYVVTESYTMDAMELGLDDENRNMMRSIYEVQKRRWQKTGLVTAISEDNINQSPWFLYNTIFNAGQPWQTTNSSDVAYDHLKTISVKAAITMALIYPEDEYSSVLMSAIESAYDPEKGWYSGIYESGAGYNTVTTANTNGVVMSGLLYKKYGSMFPHCQACSRDIKIETELLAENSEIPECTLCAAKK